MVKNVVAIQTPYFIPPHANHKFRSEVAFLLLLLYHKTANISSPLTAVIKYNRRAMIIKDNRSSKTGFTIEVIVVNITFRETLSQKILDLKILQVFIETLLIFRRN